MIGAGPDYYSSINRAKEALVKLGDEVEEWFGGLDDDYRYALLEPYQQAWEDLSWNDKLDIFKEANGYGEGVRG